MHDQYDIENKLRRYEREINCKTRFYDSFSQFPEVGISCALFIDKSNGNIYIWNGTQYVLSSGGGSGTQGIQGNTGLQGIQGNLGLQGIQGIAGSGSGSQPLAFGSFYDMTDQSVASGSVAAMKFNTPLYSSNILVQLDSNSLEPTIIACNPDWGIYNVQFSAQLYRESGGSAADVVIWLRKNYQDIPDTATKIHIANNTTYTVASWNFLIDSFALEPFQIMWTQSANIIMAHEPENLVVPYPAIPSVILTVTQVA